MLREVRIKIFEQMLMLMTTGLGLVAALAWNDAIKGLVAFLFPERSTIIASFLYAIVITAIVVIASIQLKKFIEKLRKD
ncbi:MAG: DUF5654 family protein [bacterium]|nr:DUF5654 family protein [bacterium]